MDDKVITLAVGGPRTRNAEGKEFERNPFVYLDEAACWVAFKTFDKPNSAGPMHISDLIEKADTLSRAFEAYDAKYYMALEQVLNAVTRGLITAYGRLGLEEQDPGYVKPSDTWDDGVTRLIAPIEFQNAKAHMLDEKWLVVGEHFYDTIMLSWLDVRKVFGPFVLDFGDSMLGETTSPVPANQTYRQPDFEGPKRGRPDKWKWADILTEIVVLANSDEGLPKTQAELEAWVAEKCIELYGSEPGTSTVRQKVGPIYQRLRGSRQ